MRASAGPDFTAALRLLSGSGAEFIVVGGVAAVLQGAPMNTFDLDIVHARDAGNLQRLVAALHAMDARYREHLPKTLRPEAGALAGPGHHLLITRFGPLDVLGTIGAGHDHAALATHAVELDLGDCLRVRVLDLPTIIRTKEEVSSEKDKLVLPLLKRTLEESRRQGQGGGGE